MGEEYEVEEEEAERDDRLPPPPPKTERVVVEMEPFSLEWAAEQPLGVQGLISWSDFREGEDSEESEGEGESEEEIGGEDNEY